ncbi:MAG: hypothetical protein ABIF09_15545, partial [Gemmatimonadota bacterium]
REISTSMLPTIRPYDVVVISPAGLEDLRPGDIVAVVASGGLLVHRLVKVEPQQPEPMLLLKGDAHLGQDPPLPASCLLGRVRAVERAGHRVAVDRRWQEALVRLRRVWLRLRRSRLLAGRAR